MVLAEHRVVHPSSAAEAAAAAYPVAQEVASLDERHQAASCHREAVDRAAASPRSAAADHPLAAFLEEAHPLVVLRAAARVAHHQAACRNLVVVGPEVREEAALDF